MVIVFVYVPVAAFAGVLDHQSSASETSSVPLPLFEV